MNKMLHRSSLCGLFSIFSIFFIFLSSLSVSSSESNEEETLVEEFLICRFCGADVSITNFFLNKLSPHALSAKNQTVFNHQKILVQTLENPDRIQFKVAIVRKAHCAVVNIPGWSDHFSWFPGYKWKVCFCPKCSKQIGWLFEPADNPEIESLHATSNQGFYALIVDNVLSESFVNSLLMTETEKHHSDL